MDRQTRLEKMKAYNANVRALNTRKGKARATALAPPSPPLPPLKPGTQAPPTYVQQNDEKGIKDTETHQTEKEEEEQAKAVAKGMTEVGKKDFAQGKRSTTTVSTETRERQAVKGYFAPYLGHLVNRTVQRKYHLKDNTYLPNSIMLERILFSTHKVLRPSDYLWKHHKNYLSIAVTIYYSILFYLQILRAQTEVKKIKKADSTWYRAFTRLYPEEKLVIAGPLAPFFSGLCAYKADDDKFGFVYPRLPLLDRMFERTADGQPWLFKVDEFLTIPNVPALFEQFTTYITDDFDTGANASYTKHQINHGTGAGNRTHLGVPLPEAGSWYYASSMYNRRHPDTKGQYEEAHGYWQNTNLDGCKVNKCSFNHAQPANQTQAGYPNIGEFLQFYRPRAEGGEQDGFTWFEDLLDMAIVHSRFFEGVSNLSLMPTIGGNDVPIIWLIDTLVNDDSDLRAPTAPNANKFRDLRAKAKVLIEDTESIDIQTSCIHMIHGYPCYGRDARRTDWPAVEDHRDKQFWRQPAQYEDGSFHEVIVGGAADMQTDFYIPGGN